MDQPLMERNWAGNYSFGAPVVAHPGSLEELQDVVAGTQRARALGSRHSFSDLADTDGTLVTLDRMNPDISIDPSAMTVSVGGGTRYGSLASELESQGFALHNLASLPHISVAGAVATATHGSGDGNGNLSTAVAALELVTADGSILTSRRGDPYYDGMVASLGALGIVTRLTLDIEPSFQVKQSVYEDLDWGQVLDNFEDVTAAAYSVSLFTDWSGTTVQQAWLKSRDGHDDLVREEATFFGGTPASSPKHPVPGVSGDNCTQQFGVPGPWSDRLAHFRMEFSPSKGEELQSEYLIPREHAAEALRAMRQISSAITPLLLISEIRTVAADNLWLSSSYGRDSVALHFTWRQDQPAVQALLPLLEAQLAPFDARPHWGKLFHADAAALAPLYPRMGDFTALACCLDPRGKFRNKFLDRSIFGQQNPQLR